ncbi:hypothetical protein AWZ03_003183 [Drosophila navojoa]|uniref:Uncharacterized protein n=1 Tax=Drosophila navojoa TaxID=7232 RepID=A0A484BNF4_DRONA|nr:hypothetical protein AWZ03_003183 [Drosophila navojoa]
MAGCLTTWTYVHSLCTILLEFLHNAFPAAAAAAAAAGFPLASIANTVGCLHDLTALHWAAKHGNEDVVKLIAGTYKADVNARTHGGYTPLHLATQFGRHNIFELLWNVYKANRDIMDWSGNKPLDYSRQRPSVSASTCSSEYQKYFLGTELNNNYQLGYQHVLETPLSSSGNGGGNGTKGGTLGSALTRGKKRSQLRNYATISGGSGLGAVTRTQSLLASPSSYQRYKKPSVQSVLGKGSNDDSDAESTQRRDKREPGDAGVQAPKTQATRARSIYARRKESFLRKTFRSAAGASRTPPNVVTNPTSK